MLVGMERSKGIFEYCKVSFPILCINQLCKIRDTLNTSALSLTLSASISRIREQQDSAAPNAPFPFQTSFEITIAAVHLAVAPFLFLDKPLLV